MLHTDFVTIRLFIINEEEFYPFSVNSSQFRNFNINNYNA